MKTLPRTALHAALLMAGLSPLLASVSAPLSSPEPVSSLGSATRAPADTPDEFMAKFRQAMKVGATDEMNRLIRSEQVAAISKIIQICEFIAGGSNEKLDNEIAALGKAWDSVHKTSFVDDVYEYYSLLGAEEKRHRKTLRAKYDVQNKNFLEAEAAKDKTKFGELGMQMKALGESFEQIGDYYFGSQAYLFYGRAFDEALRGSDADLKMAHDGYLKSWELREKIGLKDIYYAQAKERQSHLEAAGFGDPAKGPKSPAGPAEPTLGATITLAPTFQLVEEVDEVQRPMYTADPVYMMWPSVNMRAKGSSGKFLAMEPSPEVMRTGSAKVEVDTDGDGAGDVEVPMTGKITPVQITLGSGDTERQWGFLAVVAGDRDTFNGIQYNGAPSDDLLQLYVAPGGSLVADVAGTPIRIFDDNMDGLYGSPPKRWAYAGLIDGDVQADVDSVQIDGAKVAVPWSEYLEIGGAWYQMESADSGVEIKATPVQDLETGKLKLDLKGLDADYVIVKGVDKSRWENAYFDIASVKSGVTVPAGAYQLFSGKISKGKKAQMMKALMLPTRNTPTWTVEAGKTTTAKLGAPFGFDFHVSQDANSATVVGVSISVLGSANESYQRLWNCVVRPEVSMREEGTKRGSKGEDMKGPGSQQELADNGFNYAWFPYDLTLEKKDDERVEVQLFEKKNKLFGKIESVWR